MRGLSLGKLSVGLHSTAVCFRIASNNSHTRPALPPRFPKRATLPPYTLIRLITTTVNLQCRIQLSVNQPSNPTALFGCADIISCVKHVCMVSTFSRVEYGSTRYVCQGQLKREPDFALSQFAL